MLVQQLSRQTVPRLDLKTATRYGLTAVASVAGIGTSYESPRL